MADNDEPVRITTDRARGGATPGVTRYVLGISMVLLIAVFAFLVIHGV